MSSETKPKKRVVVNYNNLPTALQEELRSKYPNGFTESMIRIDKGPGDFFYAVVFDTSDTSYLVKVDVKIDGSLDEDDDKDYYEDDDIKGADDLSDGSDDDLDED